MEVCLKPRQAYRSASWNESVAAATTIVASERAKGNPPVPGSLAASGSGPAPHYDANAWSEDWTGLHACPGKLEDGCDLVFLCPLSARHHHALAHRYTYLGSGLSASKQKSGQFINRCVRVC